MLVDQLRMSIAAQEHAEVVERRNDTGQLDTVDEENRQRNLLLTNGVEKEIL